MNWLNAINNAARKVSGNSKIFTAENFFELMPQFTKKESFTNDEGQVIEVRKSLIPDNVLNMFIDMANKNILEQRWYEKWEYACSLYIAHYSILYLRNYKEQSESKEEVSEAGGIGLISSTSLGDASISYDNSLITQSLQKWGVWATTPYGQQLVNEAKLLGLGGAFFI